MVFMDLLFTEYASPFPLLDGLIESGRLTEFIETFQEQRKKRERWEYYIHKVPAWSDLTWEDFNKNLDGQSSDDIETVPPEQLEATVNDSYSTLQNFVPE